MTSATKAAPLPSSEQYFRQLLSSPEVAWPTIGLFILSVIVMGTSTVMAVAGQIPLWAGALVNGFAMYNLFSVGHDASHRSLSSNKTLNENLGRVAIMLMLPIAPFEAVRWIHMQHHRFTNSEMDPDQFIHHCKWWKIPFNWPNVDVYYLMYFVKHGGEHYSKHKRPVILSTSAFVALITLSVYLGYGWEVFFLWFLASRVGLFLITCVFVYLPHFPGDVDAKDNVYHATTIRKGMEWLLTPLLVYQNYHLIHHLYPTAPFYRYQKIWHLKYGELVDNDPAVQTAFGLQPVNL
jgi:fatty acid desaturase